MSFPYRGGEVPIPDDFLKMLPPYVGPQDSTERPNVPVLVYGHEREIGVVPPKPSKPVSGIISDFWERVLPVFPQPSPRRDIKREIIVTSPKKLRFNLVVSFVEPLEGIDESLLRSKFERELRFKVPSWEISCTSFVIKGGMYKRGGHYYGIMVDLVVQPRVVNVRPLRFVRTFGDLPVRNHGMQLFVMPDLREWFEEEEKDEVIVFQNELALTFRRSVGSIYWEYVYMDEITGTFSPGVLVYSEASPAIINWGDLIKPQPLPIAPQPSPVKPPPVEIPVELQPVTPVTEMPVGGMVPVSEEKKDEKTKKAFPWWVVIVIGVVALFFMMKNK